MLDPSAETVVISFFPGWIAGEPDLVKLTSALGGPGDGVLRDSITIAESALVTLPPSLSTEAAATLPCAGLTAWSAVVEHGAIQPGSVVVTQGTGGVSLFALQFAKRLGARVVATTSSEAKAQKLAELGADAIVNYSRERDWTKQARELAGGPVDLVIDVGGADTLDASLRLVRPGGTIALIGVLSGTKASITLPFAVMRRVRLQGITCGPRESLEAMIRAVAVNGFDPCVSDHFAFADAPRHSGAWRTTKPIGVPPHANQQRLLPFCHIARQSAVATARVTRKPMLQCTIRAAAFTNRQPGLTRSWRFVLARSACCFRR